MRPRMEPHYLAFCYPLINGTIVGIILGDPLTGLLAGATINLAYIGWISAGGTMPSNIGIAGVYGTAITILASADPSLAITFAIPIGLLGVLLFQLQMTVNSIWVHRLDQNAERAELDQGLDQRGAVASADEPAHQRYPRLYSDVHRRYRIQQHDAADPRVHCQRTDRYQRPSPGTGVAMLLNYLGKKYLLPYFFIGFFGATYFGLSLTAISIFGACIAVLSYFGKKQGAEEQIEEAAAAAEEETVELKKRLTKGDRRKHWLIGLGAEIGTTTSVCRPPATCWPWSRHSPPLHGPRRYQCGYEALPGVLQH